MSTRVRTLVITVATISVAAAWFYSFSMMQPTTPRVVYKSHTGDVTSPILFSRGQPTTKFGDLAETRVSESCLPRQLFQLEGEVEGDLKNNPPFVFAEFVVIRQGQEPVIANSAVGTLEPTNGNVGKYTVLINAPPKPGEYITRIRWGDQGYVARGSIRVN